MEGSASGERETGKGVLWGQVVHAGLSALKWEKGLKYQGSSWMAHCGAGQEVCLKDKIIINSACAPLNISQEKGLFGLINGPPGGASSQLTGRLTWLSSPDTSTIPPAPCAPEGTMLWVSLGVAAASWDKDTEVWGPWWLVMRKP